uniref:3'-5' exonuclease domain-containing protein n=1 Tax=Panagrolaimus sp. ES5 TaxID=591445 RepID=A0AC34GV60_9BILA
MTDDAMNVDTTSYDTAKAVSPNHPYKDAVLHATRRIVNSYSDSSIEGYIRLKQATESIDRFFAEVRKSEARVGTLFFMNFAKTKLSEIKDMDPVEITHRICLRYETYLKQKYKDEDDEEAKSVVNATVPDEIWSQCFEQAIYFRAIKYGMAIEKLFHIREPETPQRAKQIEDGIRNLLDEEKTFQNGVAWIDVFKLTKLKNEQFDTIIYKAHIIAALNVFDTFLSNEEDQIKYLKLLDECLARSLNNERFINDFELAFIQTVQRQKLPNLIGKQAKKYGFDIEKLGFRAHRARVISDIKYKYHTESRETFEHLVVEALRNRSIEYKLDFLESFSRDRRYAYCWAKFFEIPPEKMPRFLNFTDKTLEFDAEAFVQGMTKRSVTPVAEDSIETVTLFGQSYELITVGTRSALREFGQKYLIDKRPTILGLDCEAGSLATSTDSKVTVLQIATREWLCLIDVYLLSKELGDEDWTDFFKHIFHPDIERIGFAFLSDYAFIFNAFPHLLTLLQEENRKVLCLAKLVTAILTNVKAEKAVFPEKVPANISLQDICETVLGYSLSKEMQNSNWTQRPLSQEQKIYAVSDALVVVLIKDKIENALKSKLDETEVDDIMKQGYITQVAKVKGVKKDKIDIDSLIKIPKKTIDFCDIVEEAKKVAENLKSEGQEVVHPKDIKLILDAPFFNLFSFLHNLGIDAYDIRLKGVANQKQQISIMDEEMLKDDKTILVTTEKRKKEFPSIAANKIPYSRILIMPTTGDFVSINYISRILQSLKVGIDEDYFFTRCEKCSSENIQPLPSPVYILVYYIFLVIKKIGFRFSVTMEDIQKAASDVKAMNPSEYGGFNVKVFLKEQQHSKYLPEIVIDSKNYRIKPLTCQVIPKGGESATFKPSGSAFFASKPRVNHIVCTDCGNMYHKEDSKEIRDAIAAGKESYHLTSVCDNNVEEVRMKIIEIIRNVFCEKKA